MLKFFKDFSLLYIWLRLAVVVLWSGVGVLFINDVEKMSVVDLEKEVCLTPPIKSEL